jgi:hypothetical protein
MPYVDGIHYDFKDPSQKREYCKMYAWNYRALNNERMKEYNKSYTEQNKE